MLRSVPICMSCCYSICLWLCWSGSHWCTAWWGWPTGTSFWGLGNVRVLQGDTRFTFKDWTAAWEVGGLVCFVRKLALWIRFGQWTAVSNQLPKSSLLGDAGWSATEWFQLPCCTRLKCCTACGCKTSSREISQDVSRNQPLIYGWGVSFGLLLRCCVLWKGDGNQSNQQTCDSLHVYCWRLQNCVDNFFCCLLCADDGDPILVN